MKSYEQFLSEAFSAKSNPCRGCKFVIEREDNEPCISCKRNPNNVAHEVIDNYEEDRGLT